MKLRMVCTIIVALIFFPAVTSAIKADDFESDNSYTEARIIVVDDISPQHHNFHTSGDSDWIRFYAPAEEKYRIIATNIGNDSNVKIILYDKDGKTKLGERDTPLYPQADEELAYTFPEDGVYYAEIKNLSSDISSGKTGYDLAVQSGIAPPIYGNIQGYVTDIATQDPIPNAIVITADKKTSLSQPENGFYRIMMNPVGETLLTAKAEKYHDYSQTIIVDKLRTHEQNITMRYQFGNINGDDSTDLKDAIVGLKILCDIPVLSPVQLQADVDKDDKISQQEVIWILNHIANSSFQ